MSLRNNRRGMVLSLIYLFQKGQPLAYQGVPSGIGVWLAMTSCGMKEVRRRWFVGSVGDGSRDDRGLQLVFCCSTREETTGLSLGK